MATLTRDEQDEVAGTSRSLESIAEELLEARDLAEGVEDADDLDRIVRLLRSASGALRWLHADLDRLNDKAQDRGELCDECEQPEDECTCAEDAQDELEDGE